jgi:streptogramin lyase
VWALSNRDGKILVVDSRTGETLRQVSIGDGGTAVAAGFGSIWAVKAKTHSLLRLRPSNGKRIGAAIGINYPGQPNIVAVGEQAIWVGVRKSGVRDGLGESLVRVDRSSGGQDAIGIPGGVGDIAVGDGAVWVTTNFSRNVIRVNPDNLHDTRTVSVGDQLNGIAVGEGAVWVAVAGDKSLRRINPKTYNVRRIALGVAPARVTVGGGSVWVTARSANQLFRINPKTLEIREQIETGIEPFALDVADGKSVWLTLLDQGDGAVQRMRFYP